MDFLDRSIVLRGAADENENFEDFFKSLSMASFLLAMETKMPQISFLDTVVHLGGNRFSRERILDAKVAIVTALEGKAVAPTPCMFLACYKKLRTAYYRNKGMDAGMTRFLNAAFERAQYLVELSILDVYFIGRRPSIVALAAAQVAVGIARPVPGDGLLALPNLPLAWAHYVQELSSMKSRLRSLMATRGMPPAKL